MRVTFPLTALLLAYALVLSYSYSRSPVRHCPLQVISMRTLALLGKCDPGAPRAFTMHILLASLLVATP